MAGYSGTPLLQKLGIKPGMKLKLIHEPLNYEALLEKKISDLLCSGNELPDLVHLFVTSQKEFKEEMTAVKPLIKENPSLILWVSWHKKSSGISTDLTEDHIRNYALKNGLVDIKVCAVSEIWSGLKLVVPLAKR
jgi:hypothetical protein